ncbi:MAG: hypothetical protein EOP04_20015 [Proteobacteria bacterium]|nr:MAG: hypothetical protein EOP04_20015 [Pseudomonadota bacterium]
MQLFSLRFRLKPQSFLATKLKDSEVYWLLRYILNKKKFDDVLVDGFPRVQLLNYQLDVFARNYIPELVDYLVRH